jgi:HAE1 family hydrophobic/amphiphilic exporter-1
VVNPKHNKTQRQLRNVVKLAAGKAAKKVEADKASQDKAIEESSFLARLSITRPMFVTCLVLLTLFIGYLSLESLGVDLFPEIEIPVVTVVVPYRGAGPAEIETLVVRPLEDELSTLAGIKRILSNSNDGAGVVTCQFYTGTDMKNAEQQVRNRVQNIRNKLPKEVDEPNILRINLSDQPVVEVDLSSELPEAQLYDLANEDLKAKLEQAPGVGKVDLLGGRKREIQVELDRGTLKNKSTSAGLVVGRIGENSSNVPVGKVTKGAIDTSFRTIGEYRSLTQIADAVVNFYDRPVRVRDLGQVKDGLEDAKSLSYLDGKPALSFKIYKQSGTNTVQVVDGVIKQIDKINAQLKGQPGNNHIQVVRDGALWIRQNVDDVAQTIAIGILLVILVVYFFLGNFRSTFITGLALPNSLLGAFILMKLAGFTINIMTLLALSLSVGLLIDDAIVVRENIFRLIEKGMRPFEAALRGTKEVSLAVIATSSVVIAVFLPVGFLSGTVGKFLGQFGLTMCFAMAISLFDALTIAPMLSAYFAGKGEHDKEPSGLSLWGALVGAVATAIVGSVLNGAKGAGLGAVLGAVVGMLAPMGVAPFSRFQDWLELKYEGILSWVLSHRIITLTGTVILFLVSVIGGGGYVTKTFIPTSDGTEFQVLLELPAGASLEKMAEVALQADAIVRKHPEIDVTSTTVEDNTARIYASLKPSGQRVLTSQELKTLVREELKPFAYANPRVGDVDASGANQAPYQLVLKGDDLDALSKFATELQARLAKEVPGLVDLDSSYRLGKPEFQVKLDPAKAGRLGVSTVGAGQELRIFTDGAVAGKYREGGREYDIRVRLRPEQRDLEAGYAETWVPNLNNTLVRLASVSSSQKGRGPASILRRERTRAIEIDAQIGQGAGLSEILEGSQKVLKSMQAPPGLSYDFVGQAEDFADLGHNIAIALMLAVVIMYLVLVSLYESFITPVTIMLALPLGIAGAFVALASVEWMTNHGVLAALHQMHLFHVKRLDASLNLFSMIGLILLMGLVAKNSILLVDLTMNLIREGMPRQEALLKAGRTRLRPILMTSLALFFGTLPLALALSEAGRFRSSMGIGIAGGLVSSTLLTLVVVPAAFGYIDDFRGWFEGLFRKLGGHE